VSNLSGRRLLAGIVLSWSFSTGLLRSFHGNVGHQWSKCHTAITHAAQYPSLTAVYQFTSQLQKVQEAQQMLTNPRDAFRGQSRSPNMVPFDILGMVSY